MRIPSKAVLIISGASTCLLIAVAAVQSINKNMKQEVETGAFENQYAVAIETLNDAVRGVQNQIDGNIDTGRETFQPETPRSGLPAEPVEDVAGNIILQGISWTRDLPLALVNGRLYGIGEPIGSSTLKTITTDSIVLEDGRGRKNEIRLVETLQ